MNYYLGIDIGTTKVATVICDSKGDIVELQSFPTKAAITTSSEQFEQDYRKIFLTLDKCINKFSKNILQRVISIGVTGQMHGVILWGKSKVSNLITWQDKRCNESILSQIEKCTTRKLSSGLGSATLFWIMKNGLFDSDYSCAATIHDYLVASLCNLKHPVTDPTNAASWGLFDIFSLRWEEKNLKKLKIPYNIYPYIVPSGSIAGRLGYQYSKKWNLNINIPVFTAIGDNQASLLATLKDWDNEIALTIGTGAQVSTVLPLESNIATIKEGKYEIRPFIKGRYIIVGASLCGGSAFAWLINWFSQWCEALKIKIPENSSLYNFFIEEGMKEGETDLFINPNFLGERHTAELLGEIRNINLNNFTSGNIARALARGIIHNLKSMIPDNIIADKQQIIASGNALRKNALLAQMAEEILDKPIKIIDSCEEAACGTVVLQQLHNQNNATY